MLIHYLKIFHIFKGYNVNGYTYICTHLNLILLESHVVTIKMQIYICTLSVLTMEVTTLLLLHGQIDIVWESGLSQCQFTGTYFFRSVSIVMHWCEADTEPELSWLIPFAINRSVIMQRLYSLVVMCECMQLLD